MAKPVLLVVMDGIGFSKTGLGDAVTEATVNKFTSLVEANAEVVDVAKWGKRRLAYPINDMNEGYYTVVTFKAPASFIAELDRLFNIDEAVMRKLVIRLEHEPTAKPAAEPAIEAPAAEVAETEAAADAE